VVLLALLFPRRADGQLETVGEANTSPTTEIKKLFESLAGEWDTTEKKERTQFFSVRTKSDPHNAISAVTEAIHQVGPDIPVTDAPSMGDVIAQSMSPQPFNMLLLAAFAGLALQAAVGAYGMLSYTVRRRLSGNRDWHGAGCVALRRLAARGRRWHETDSDWCSDRTSGIAGVEPLGRVAGVRSTAYGPADLHGGGAAACGGRNRGQHVAGVSGHTRRTGADTERRTAVRPAAEVQPSMASGNWTHTAEILHVTVLLPEMAP
jgi:hypothetical protein